MPKNVSVSEAHTLQQAGATYVDVRSSGEYAAGHPAGAVNVPLLERDEHTGQMQPNPDFARVMQANFPADASLLIGCQVGGRSARAAQMLEAFGFADVSNVKGGFGGRADPIGRVLDPGWARSALARRDRRRRRDGATRICSPRPTPDRDRPQLSRLGTPAGVGRHQSRRPAVRVGSRLARPRRRSPTPAAGVAPVGHHDAGQQRRVLRDAARPTTSSCATACCGSRARSSRRLRSTTPSSSACFPRGRSTRPQPRRAVVVLPQWNADPEGHVGLCQLFARFGITALRLSLPYHDARRPPELERADYIVSANVGRTLQANRQAVLDARRAVALARARGIRADRHHGHEPRLVPGDAHDGARAAS